MKVSITILVILLCLLQYRLWLGDGNLLELRRYQQQVEKLEQKGRKLRERNQILRVEVENLTTGGEAVEERARQDLGMVRRDEFLFQIIEKQKD